EEARNLQWNPGTKVQLQWDNALNADFYRVNRGDAADLPRLLTGEPNACLDDSSPEQRSVHQLFTPHAGSFFWYLVVGANGGAEGPSGFARIGSAQRGGGLSRPGS